MRLCPALPRLSTTLLIALRMRASSKDFSRTRKSTMPSTSGGQGKKDGRREFIGKWLHGALVAAS